jgi:hypothetical protein
MMVAKSGRTTGLTCAAVSAISVDVTVDYFTDCAETTHSMTKTFLNQIAIAGTSFSDAGDSGALVVDSANAEPVGLFFAGGTDAERGGACHRQSGGGRAGYAGRRCRVLMGRPATALWAARITRFPA